MAAPAPSLRVRYRKIRSGLPVSPGDVEPPIIALAPVLEDPGDASIAVNAKARVYGVNLHYEWERMGRIFDAALDSGGRVLLLPEMTVRHADAPRLMKLFKDNLRERRRATGDFPSLYYVIAGLVAGRNGDGTSGTNEVALFHALQDETSEPFVRQASCAGGTSTSGSGVSRWRPKKRLRAQPPNR